MRDFSARLAKLKTARPASAASTRLRELTGFAPNPGALAAYTYLPDGLAPGAALVVVLHGCTQRAADYDHGAGWSTLADRHGFALLFPEQRRENNPNLCFNWFTPADTRRDAGEAASIAAMIAHVAAAHAIDPERVFVTGLSAGGAMTSVMLACYPEVFAGGAIIAGLPYGVAQGVPGALEAMRGTAAAPDPAALAACVRRASPHAGPWPTVSVWHGDADRTVAASNADAVVAQWLGVHGLPGAPARTERVDGHPRRVWCAPGGRELVEEYRIAGMGHGTPLDPAGPHAHGVAAPHMLDAGIASSHHIARFWGLTGHAAAAAARPRPAPDPRVRILTPEPRARAAPRPAPESGVARVIEDALRSAGLMK